MCRVVVCCFEHSCLRTFKPAWKQGRRLRKSGVNDRHSLSFLGCEEQSSVSPCGCWRVYLWQISKCVLSCLCSVSIWLVCTNKVIVHHEHDANL